MILTTKQSLKACSFFALFENFLVIGKSGNELNHLMASIDPQHHGADCYSGKLLCYRSSQETKIFILSLFMLSPALRALVY